MVRPTLQARTPRRRAVKGVVPGPWLGSGGGVGNTTTRGHVTQERSSTEKKIHSSVITRIFPVNCSMNQIHIFKGMINLSSTHIQPAICTAHTAGWKQSMSSNCASCLALGGDNESAGTGNLSVPVLKYSVLRRRREH